MVFFSNAGAPATGLTPTIGVYKKVSDATDVTPAPTVSEIGGGFYKFTATPAEALVVRMNGGGSLSDADKYKVMQITPQRRWPGRRGKHASPRERRQCGGDQGQDR